MRDLGGTWAHHENRVFESQMLDPSGMYSLASDCAIVLGNGRGAEACADRPRFFAWLFAAADRTATRFARKAAENCARSQVLPALSCTLLFTSW